MDSIIMEWNWLLKFRKVIYPICYNSYIDIPFLDFTAVCSRQDCRGIDLIECLSGTRLWMLLDRGNSY